MIFSIDEATAPMAVLKIASDVNGRVQLQVIGPIAGTAVWFGKSEDAVRLGAQFDGLDVRDGIKVVAGGPPLEFFWVGDLYASLDRGAGAVTRAYGSVVVHQC